MAKKNVTLKDEASNELNPETVITQVKDSSNAALFTEASGTISTTSGHTINGASITDSSITSDKLATKEVPTSFTGNVWFGYESDKYGTNALHIGLTNTSASAILTLNGDDFITCENNDSYSQYDNYDLITFGATVNLNDYKLYFNTDDDVSIEYDSSGNELVFNINGGSLKMNSDGYLIVSSNLEIEDDRFNYLDHEMLLFERSGSSPNYRYNINFQENDITNTGTIYTYGGARFDSDGCIYNEDNTAIEIKTSDRSGNTELNHSYLYLDSDGDGFELNSKGNQTGKVIAVKSDTPNAFSHDIAYTFKEDSIYRKVDNGNDVDLIPHLYCHNVEIDFGTNPNNNWIGWVDGQHVDWTTTHIYFKFTYYDSNSTPVTSYTDFPQIYSLPATMGVIVQNGFRGWGAVTLSPTSTPPTARDYYDANGVVYDTNNNKVLYVDTNFDNFEGEETIADTVVQIF